MTHSSPISASQASTTAANSSASAKSLASAAAAHSESDRCVFMAFSFGHIQQVSQLVF